MTATVVQSEDGTWRVVGHRGRVIADGLTNAQAWEIWDNQDKKAAIAEEKRRRISIATGQW